MFRALRARMQQRAGAARERKCRSKHRNQQPKLTQNRLHAFNAPSRNRLMRTNHEPPSWRRANQNHPNTPERAEIWEGGRIVGRPSAVKAEFAGISRASS